MLRRDGDACVFNVGRDGARGWLEASGTGRGGGVSVASVITGGGWDGLGGGGVVCVWGCSFGLVEMV